MITRELGRTGEKVSVFGFGGIVVKDVEPNEAHELVAESVDRGINYFDVAPSYGNAQDRLGPALQPYRDRILLACKTGERTREGATRELLDSLHILKTDHFDVYQLHGIDDPQDIEQVLGPGGALEALREAREKGLIRYIGFSCHAQQSALQLMDSFDFDTILFPINWCYWLNRDAGQEVLAMAEEKNMGRIAMKSLAHRKWREDEKKVFSNCWYRPIYDDCQLAELALRFTLSRSVSVALSPGDARMLRIGLDILEKLEESDQGFELTKDALNRLRQLAAQTEPIFIHPA